MQDVFNDVAKEDLVKRFSGSPTANLSDAMGKTGTMNYMIKPVYAQAKLVGPAFTLTCHPADNVTIHKAVYSAPSGSVLVINAGGYPEGGLFGDILALACQVQGIAGVVMDGGCRDVEELEAMNFPVFARSISPRGTIKKTVGAIGETIQCGGLLVGTGDIVVGDRDGVVVVPLVRAKEVLRKVTEILQNETKYRQLIKEGKSTIEIFSLNV